MLFSFSNSRSWMYFRLTSSYFLQIFHIWLTFMYVYGVRPCYIKKLWINDHNNNYREAYLLFAINNVVHKNINVFLHKPLNSFIFFARNTSWHAHHTIIEAYISSYGMTFVMLSTGSRRKRCIMLLCCELRDVSIKVTVI